MRAYLSKWPEERILEYFRYMTRQDADRLALLQQLAVVAVERPDEWSPLAVRQEHEATARQSADKCFCCRTGDRRLYWHHIVAIQHGGSNAWDNLVPICKRCHAAIHPWMDGEGQDKRRTSWRSIAAIVEDSFGADVPELVAVAERRDRER
jgi:hypothetical protein